MGNQNVLKYIYYVDSDDPLSQTDVTQDLIQTGNIILTPYNPTLLSQEKICLFINPYEGNLKHQPLSDITFLIDVIIPINKWLLAGLGEIRAFRIADEIAQLIDQKSVAGIGQVEIEKFRMFKLDDTYGGLTLWVKVNSSSMKGLR
jgi:hypothetical protein